MTQEMELFVENVIIHVKVAPLLHPAIPAKILEF